MTSRSRPTDCHHCGEPGAVFSLGVWWCAVHAAALELFEWRKGGSE